MVGVVRRRSHVRSRGRRRDVGRPEGPVLSLVVDQRSQRGVVRADLVNEVVHRAGVSLAVELQGVPLAVVCGIHPVQDLVSEMVSRHKWEPR